MVTHLTRPTTAPLFLAALVAAGAFLVFPFGSDAEYAVFDPVWYAAGAERGTADAVLAHHPLFHLLVAGIASVAEALGMSRPGHVATRMLSGLGAAAILLMLAGLAGRRRWRVGAGLALFLLVGRTWFLEAFTGENVLPAVAVGLAALIAAMDERVSWVRVGVLTVLALLLRQDNLLLVPAVVLGLHWREGRPTCSRLMAWLAVVGGATMLAYVAIWAGLRLAGVDQDLIQWVWGIGKDDYSLVAHPVLEHGAAFGITVVGKQWAATNQWTHVGVGASALALLAVCGVFFRGDARWERFAVLAGLTGAVRFAFYSWFEPTNPEWTLFTFTLVAAVAARACRGEPATAPSVRWAAALLLVTAGCGIWAAHADDTLSLRQHRLEPAGLWVKEHTKKGWGTYGFQNKAVLAVEMVGTKCKPLYTDFERARQHLKQVVTRDRQPLLVVVDVGVQTGMPYDMRQLRRKWRGMKPVDPPLARVLWERDGVYVVGFLVPE